jgi:eukaryotic-like serine/threonine-protein kinase
MSDKRFGLVADRYQLRDQLGLGGMGRVWLARDEMLDRDVAIKEVAPPPRLSPEEAVLLRNLINREARAAARINHPNVVKIFDVLQTENWPWLIMEYVPSMSLQKVVQHNGPLPPVEVAKIGLAVLEGLTAAHDSGVLHRDVKPDNVLLADDGRVMLTDFGLASLDTDGNATHSSTLGTPQYVAPERARHGTSSREADLWSLGATLYAAVEGRTPYGRESVLETLSALAMDPPDPMRLAGPLEPVIAGLLQRDPARRTHPVHLAIQLQAVIEGGAAPLRFLPAQAAPPRLPVASSPGLAASPRLRAISTPAVPPEHPHWRGRLVLASAGALTLVAVVGLAVMANKFGGSPQVPGTPSAARSALVCENTPTEAAAIPVVPPPGNGFALPKGWAWFVDQKGDQSFVVGVPDAWTYWRSGTIVCFRDLYGSRTMSVVPGRVPAETLPDYHLVSRENITAHGQATEWEFTFTGLERKRHAIALVTPGPTLLWITDDYEFSASRALYDLAKVSFEPGRGDKPPRGGGPGEGQGPGPGGSFPPPKP